MQLYFRILILSLLSVFVLAGCRGDSPYDSADATDNGANPDDDDDDDDDDTDAGASGKSYLPLSVYEAYKEYSGASLDSVFQLEYWLDPANTNTLIVDYLINPVDAGTLDAISSATTTDYTVTVDGLEVDDTESFPLLQKMIGNETSLQTALVFDLSNSIHDVDMQALVNEAKAYVASAQAHSNKTINSQEFVVWAFGEQVEELTEGFTSNTAEINTALDEVITLYNNRNLRSGSNLHRAIVEVVGRYNSTDGEYDFWDETENDLIDTAGNRGVSLSQLVMFSAGPDTSLEFSQAEMTRAIKSQSFLKYDENAASNSEDMIYLNKPVFYYVLGGTTAGETYTALSGLSESVSSLTLLNGVYDFDSSLIVNQLSAIDKRIDLDNQYLFRFAFVPRVGEHTVVFASKSTGHNYSLTSTFSKEYMESISGTGTPEELLTSLVEITGSGGEYISDNDLYLSEESTFAPATRWTTQPYASTDYSWSITNGTGTSNANGTFTVTSVQGTATLTLTNNARTTKNTASITISN